MRPVVQSLARLAGRSRAIAPDGILNALPSPVFVVDADDNLTYLNAAAEQFFHGSEATLLGENLQNLFPQDNPILSLAQKVRRQGSSMTEYGVQVSTPRIGQHSLSVDAAPLSDTEPEIVFVLQADRIANKIDETIMQKGAARSVSALSSMLGHEVKNPLSGIRGSAQLLETLVAPEDRSLTQLIIQETDRIVKLVDRFEVFSEGPVLERQNVNIHEVLDHVLALARAGFGKHTRFTTDYDPSLPMVFGNRDQLIQIFLNLVKNGVEATENIGDGEVTVVTAFRHGVRLAVPGSESRMYLPMMVSVRDNGVGVPDDLRPHLFDPFITTKRGGSGLGLALTAKLVSDHGGIIDLESKARRTSFNVLLPLVRRGEDG